MDFLMFSCSSVCSVRSVRSGGNSRGGNSGNGGNSRGGNSGNGGSSRGGGRRSGGGRSRRSMLMLVGFQL